MTAKTTLATAQAEATQTAAQLAAEAAQAQAEANAKLAQAAEIKAEQHAAEQAAQAARHAIADAYDAHPDRRAEMRQLKDDLAEARRAFTTAVVAGGDALTAWTEVRRAAHRLAAEENARRDRANRRDKARWQAIEDAIRDLNSRQPYPYGRDGYRLPNDKLEALWKDWNDELRALQRKFRSPIVREDNPARQATMRDFDLYGVSPKLRREVTPDEYHRQTFAEAFAAAVEQAGEQAADDYWAERRAKVKAFAAKAKDAA